MPVETLKPQDILVACQVALAGTTIPTHEWLGKTLHLSPSTVYEALKRCRQSKLVTGTCQGGRSVGVKIVPQKLYEFLVHAVPILYYPRLVAPVRGLPTAAFSPLFRERFTKPGDLVVVWPYSKGKEIGEGLLPIYPSIPIASSQNPTLHQMMAAVDLLRIGKVREKKAAASYLEELLEVDSREPDREEVA
jgi:hypothetical protein